MYAIETINYFAIDHRKLVGSMNLATLTKNKDICYGISGIIFEA